MLISELIEKLKELKEKYGDSEVYYSQDVFEPEKGYIVDDVSYQEHIIHPDYEGGLSDICTAGILITT